MPWLGASPRRTLRGMIVLNTLSLKKSRTSPRHELTEVRAVVVHRAAGRLRCRGWDSAPPRMRRMVPTRSARPSSAKYSQCSGIRTASAATSALSVRRPSDGGQSMKMNSKSRSQRVQLPLEPAFALEHRHHLDFGAREVAVGRNQVKVRDRCRHDPGVADVLAHERFVGRPAGRPLPFQADATRQVSLRICIDQKDLSSFDRQRRRHVQGRGGLPDAALLVGDGDDPAVERWIRWLLILFRFWHAPNHDVAVEGSLVRA